MSAQPDFDSTSRALTSPDLDLLRLTLEQLPDDFAILAMDLTIEWLAPRFAARLNIDASKARGLNWFSVHAQAAHRHAEYARAAAGETIDFAALPVRRAGHLRHFHTHLQPLIDAQRIRGLLVREQDVTAKFANADRELRRLALVRSVPNDSHDVVTLVDASGNILAVSDSAISVIGHAPEELVGRSIFHGAHPDDLPDARQRFAGGLYCGGEIRMYRLQGRQRHANGSWRWIESLTVNALTDPSIAAIIVYSHDVTAEHALAEQLNGERGRFTIALDCAQVGFYEYDVALDCVAGLDEWSQRVGLPELIGNTGHLQQWSQAIHPEDQMLARDYLAAYLARDESSADSTPFEFEYRVRHKDGARWVWILTRAQVIARDANGRAARCAGIMMDIERRKRLELAMGATESRLSTAIWGASFGLWELDITNNHATWFSDWCRAEGIEPCAGSDHVSNWDAKIHADDLPAAETLFSKMLRGEVDVYEAEYRVRTVSGDWRWVFERSRAVAHDAQGTPTRVVGICMNIDARKHAEEALRRSEFRYRSVAELTPGYVNEYVFDEAGEPRLSWASQGFESVYGYTVEQVQQQPRLAQYLTFEQRQRARGRMAALLEGQAGSGEAQVRNADGSERWLHIAARPVFDPATGRVTAALGVVQDITQRKHQENQLRLQAHILETMREGVVLLDDANCIRVTNPSFDAMFGSSAGPLVGEPFAILLPGDDAARIERSMELRRQLADSRDVPLEFECRRFDGKAFAAAGLATRTTVGARDHLLLVLSDVTDRKLLEHEILEVSNREQQRIGADLHDGLGQELTGVALMLRGLALRINRDFPGERHGIDEIITLVNHTVLVTRTLARGLSPVSTERGGLLPALRALAAEAGEAFGIKVALRTRLPVTPRLDESAANHLHRIVQEALSNALRHGHARNVRLHFSSDAKGIRLSIRDDGRGIRVGDTNKGGLGLRTMNYRAQVIGGQLTVRAHRDGGTIVSCICPQDARASSC